MSLREAIVLSLRRAGTGEQQIADILATTLRLFPRINLDMELPEGHEEAVIEEAAVNLNLPKNAEGACVLGGKIRYEMERLRHMAVIPQ